MSLIEYLYVDRRRLDAYVEQIASPVEYDKVPTWSAGLSVTGPKAGVNQARPARTRTTHEKIQLLLKHLRDAGELSTRRPMSEADAKTQKVFVLEKCNATKIVVPPDPARGGAAGTSLVLWISQGVGDRVDTLLLLLEDDPQTDYPPYRASTGFLVSSFTLLSTLLKHLDEEGQRTILAPRFVPDEGEPGSRRSDITRRALRYVARFCEDPFETLKTLGCIPSTSRQIDVLYRIRLYGAELGFSPWIQEGAYEWSPDGWNGVDRKSLPVSTFAYPIFIAAGGI